MKAITVKYRGPRTRGARFVASDNDGNCITIPYDYVTRHDKHAARAAEALVKKMGKGWGGRWHGGAIKGGWVFVCEDPDSTFEVK